MSEVIVLAVFVLLALVALAFPYAFSYESRQESGTWN